GDEGDVVAVVAVPDWVAREVHRGEVDEDGDRALPDGVAALALDPAAWEPMADELHAGCSGAEELLRRLRSSRERRCDEVKHERARRRSVRGGRAGKREDVLRAAVE